MPALLDTFRVLASLCSTLMILSPISSIYHMHKHKSTGVASIVPLVSMFANCHITVLYAYLNHNIFPLFTTFVTGEFFSIVYIIVFYRYTKDRAIAHKVMAGFGLLCALTTLYTFLGGYGLTHQSKEDVTLIVGYVCILVTVVQYVSPFLKVGQVLKYHSGVFIPIHMVAANALSNIMWVIVSLLTDDWIIFGACAFCFCMGIVQIVLYGIYYPPTHPLLFDILPTASGKSSKAESDISVTTKAAAVASEDHGHALGLDRYRATRTTAVVARVTPGQVDVK